MADCLVFGAPTCRPLLLCQGVGVTLLRASVLSSLWKQPKRRKERKQPTGLAWPYLALLTIRNIASIYTPYHLQNEPDREQNGPAEPPRQVRPPHGQVAPARPVTKHPGHCHYQNRQAHHQNLGRKVRCSCICSCTGTCTRRIPIPR